MLENHLIVYTLEYFKWLKLNFCFSHIILNNKGIFLSTFRQNVRHIICLKKTQLQTELIFMNRLSL